jgi:hypothetical protein
MWYNKLKKKLIRDTYTQNLNQNSLTFMRKIQHADSTINSCSERKFQIEGRALSSHQKHNDPANTQLLCKLVSYLDHFPSDFKKTFFIDYRGA